MKYVVYLFLSLSLTACGGKTGKEEKELATKNFIDCDFYSAKKNAELAVDYAGGNVKVSVPALLIIGKSSEFLGQQSTAYEKIVELVPGVDDKAGARKIADQFVQRLSTMAPDKVKSCTQLQG